MANTKPVVRIYLKPKARSTDYLLKHIAKHIDSINRIMILDMVYITPKNVDAIKRLGITHAPTLVYRGQFCVSVEKIISKITPAQDKTMGYGPGAASTDEMVENWQLNVIKMGDEEPAESDETALRRKMAAFQKRRPSMEGVTENKAIRGGRKVVARAPPSNNFQTDDDFLTHSKVYDQIQTPSEGDLISSDDGDRLLEDYYNYEADMNGRKPNTKPIRWR